MWNDYPAWLAGWKRLFFFLLWQVGLREWSLFITRGNGRAHVQWLLKNGEMLAGKAVCHNLIKRAFYFQQQQEWANRKRKLRKSKSSKMTGECGWGPRKGARVSWAWSFHKETNAFSKWQRRVTFAKWFWLAFQLSFCSKKWRRVGWGKQFSQWGYKTLQPNEMFSLFRDNNPLLLGFMPNIDSLWIFYGSLDEIQLIVFYWNGRVSLFNILQSPHPWFLLPFPLLPINSLTLMDGLWWLKRKIQTRLHLSWSTSSLHSCKGTEKPSSFKR